MTFLIYMAAMGVSLWLCILWGRAAERRERESRERRELNQQRAALGCDICGSKHGLMILRNGGRICAGCHLSLESIHLQDRDL